MGFLLVVVASRLLKFHLFAFASVFLAALYATQFPPRLIDIPGAIVCGAFALVPLVAWPQICFRSARRRIAFDRYGIHTSIWKISGKFPWGKIASIRVVGENIYIV